MTGSRYASFRHYDADAASDSREMVRELYEQSYVDAIATGDPFESVSAFMERFDKYVRNPQLDMVVAFLDEEPVGQAWGWPLSGRTGWWNGLLAEPEPGFTDEDGTRTFALSEIMVRQSQTGQGIAHRMHDALLERRSERRATLLAEPANEKAYQAYQRWGWRKVAQLRPGWAGSPTFDVLVRTLDDLAKQRDSGRAAVRELADQE